MCCDMSNHYVACPITVCVCVCFLAGNNESILCTVGQLYYVSESQFLKSVCARLCSDLWKWDFNTITSWAIINSLLKYWALYPWKRVSAAIRVKQWLTLAVIEFWSCYSRRIHLIGNILNTCSAVRLLLSFHSKVNMKSELTWLCPNAHYQCNCAQFK